MTPTGKDNINVWTFLDRNMWEIAGLIILLTYVIMEGWN